MLINGEMRFRAYRQDAVEMVAKALEIYGALGALCADPSIEVIVRPGGPARIAVSGDAIETTEPEPQPAEIAEIPAAVPLAQNGNGRPLAMVAARPPWSQIPKAQRPEEIAHLGCDLTLALGHAPTMEEWNVHRPADWPSAGGLPKTYGPNWAALREQWEAAAVVIGAF